MDLPNLNILYKDLILILAFFIMYPPINKNKLIFR